MKFTAGQWLLQAPLLISSLFTATVKAGEGKGPSPPTACGHMDQYGGMGAGNIWVTQDDGELFCNDDECCSAYGWCGRGEIACTACLFYYSGPNSPCTPDHDPGADFHVFLVLIDNTGKKWVQYPNGTIVDYQDQMYFVGGFANYGMDRWELDDDYNERWSGLPLQPAPMDWNVVQEPTITPFQGMMRDAWKYWDEAPPGWPHNDDYYPISYWSEEKYWHGKEYDITFVDEYEIHEHPLGGPYTPVNTLITSTLPSKGTVRPTGVMFNPATIWPEYGPPELIIPDHRYIYKKIPGYDGEIERAYRAWWYSQPEEYRYPGWDDNKQLNDPGRPKPTLYRTRGVQSAEALLRPIAPLSHAPIPPIKPGFSPAPAPASVARTPTAHVPPGSLITSSALPPSRTSPTLARRALNPRDTLPIVHKRKVIEPLSGLAMIDADPAKPVAPGEVGRIYAKKVDPEAEDVKGRVMPTLITKEVIKRGPTTIRDYGVVVTPAAVWVYAVPEGF